MGAPARFLALWGRPQDPISFERHYRDVHIPLALKLPGLSRYTLSRNIAPIRSHDPCYLVAELDFDDLDSLQAAFQSRAGRDTAADIANLAQYATVESVIYELEDLVK